MKKLLFIILVILLAGQAFAADTKVSAIPAPSGGPVRTDKIYIVDDPGGTPASAADTIANVIGLSQTSDIKMPMVGSPTYTDLQSILSMYFSASIITGGTITDNGDGTVDVAAGTAILKTTDSEIGSIISVDFDAAADIALTDESNNLVYVDYNGGTVTISAVTPTTGIDAHTQVLLGFVRRDGTSLHITPYGGHYADFFKKDTGRQLYINGIQRKTGLIATETGTMNLYVTAGQYFVGNNTVDLAIFDSSGTDSFSSAYRNGSGGWTIQTAQTTIDWTHYDDGTGTLATLGNNQYSIWWVYRMADGDIYIVYGRDSYLLAGAVAAQIPSDIPGEVATTTASMLIAKLIIQKENTTTFTQVQYPWTETFGGESVADHANLANLYGDSPYYHLGETAYGYASQLPAINSLTPVSDDADNFASNFTGNNLKGGTFIANAAGTAVLAAAASGQNYLILNGGANAVTLDPDAAGTEDTFVLVTPTGGYDATVAQGGTVSTSTSGAACTVQYLAADTLLLFCDDNWAKD